jgi:hypothetical protein
MELYAAINSSISSQDRHESFQQLYLRMKNLAAVVRIGLAVVQFEDEVGLVQVYGLIPNSRSRFNSLRAGFGSQTSGDAIPGSGFAGG